MLFFDGVVTAKEDYNRHRDDDIANSRKTLTLKPAKDGSGRKEFQEVPWRDIAVGDIVKVRRGEELPADLVFLASGHANPEQRGVCHVQTAQLDGETNLKLRQAHKDCASYFTSDQACEAFRGYLNCVEPTEHFEKFDGVLYMTRG